MESNLIEHLCEVLEPYSQHIRGDDLKVDGGSILAHEPEAGGFGKDGTLVDIFRVGVLPEDLELEVEVQRRVEEVVEVKEGFFTECDEARSHDDMNILFFVGVKPEGAMERKCIAPYFLHDILGDGPEDGILAGVVALFIHEAN
jgi:hypothetical protein